MKYVVLIILSMFMMFSCKNQGESSWNDCALEKSTINTLPNGEYIIVMYYCSENVSLYGKYVKLDSCWRNTKTGIKLTNSQNIQFDNLIEVHEYMNDFHVPKEEISKQNTAKLK